MGIPFSILPTLLLSVKCYQNKNLSKCIMDNKLLQDTLAYKRHKLISFSLETGNEVGIQSPGIYGQPESKREREIDLI